MDDQFDLTPGSLPVTDLVGDDIERVRADVTLRDVCATLSESGIGVVGVDAAADGSRLAGVVSERDIVAGLAAGLDPDKATAGDVATEHLLYVDPTATIDEVANEMLTNWTRHLLVGAPDALVGIVSARDLLGAYAADAGRGWE